ncbi:MAG: septal ring lytic transglycosylase RlpA family protein [Myxococcota bacterium]
MNRLSREIPWMAFRTMALAAIAACGAATTTAQSGGALEVREGRASYYADSLAGRPTASGEPYDPTKLTAASRDLPFGTRVRVVRLDREGNDLASVEVRINDRGPHRDRRRILDLSRAAAEALDMIRAGVVPIRAEILSRPDP